MNKESLREKHFLRFRYRAMLSYTGAILAICGMLMLTPLLLLPANPGELAHIWAFVTPAAVLLVGGMMLSRIFQPPEPIGLNVQEGGVIVLLSWITVIAFSAWPFVSILGLDATRAVFESVSGWTTTGLSVVDVTRAGKMVLLWRSTMQLAGGAGLAILMMSAVIGPVGAGVSSAEGRADQLVPHVRQSARLVLVIYGGYATAGVIAYRLAGMSLFDAVTHSFAAVSTGGFSTRVESIGFWDSAAVESITIALMILGNLSFVTAWLFLRGKMRWVIRNGEIRLMTVLLPLAAAAVFVITCRGLYPQLGKSVRVAIFESVSALTTTGFSTVSYGDWNSFGVFVMILLMLIGGGACSTAGGIKQFRVYMLWKIVSWELHSVFLPSKAVLERPVWEGERRIFVSDSRLSQICAYVFLYLTTYCLGTLILCASGFSVHDSLFEFASALGTVGLSVGITSAEAPDTVLWAETAAMFLGRLEFVVVLMGVLKLSGDLRRMFSSANRSGHAKRY
jgi:trk system potassium uptake protein TrkH